MANELKTKVCSKCKVEKSAEEYYNHKANKTGKHSWCKECVRKSRKKYYKEHVEETCEKVSVYYKKNKDKLVAKGKDWCKKNRPSINKRQRDWKNKHPELVAKSQFNGKYRKVSINNRPIKWEDKINMFNNDPFCNNPKCRKPFKSIGEAHFDHDHKTMEARGLLCSNCNRGIGYYNDDIEKLKGIIQYLETTNAQP